MPCCWHPNLLPTLLVACVCRWHRLWGLFWSSFHASCWCCFSSISFYFLATGAYSTLYKVSSVGCVVPHLTCWLLGMLNRLTGGMGALQNVPCAVMLSWWAWKRALSGRGNGGTLQPKSFLISVVMKVTGSTVAPLIVVGYIPLWNFKGSFVTWRNLTKYYTYIKLCSEHYMVIVFQNIFFFLFGVSKCWRCLNLLGAACGAACIDISPVVATLVSFCSLRLWLRNCNGKTADANGIAGHAGRKLEFDTTMHMGIGM